MAINLDTNPTQIAGLLAFALSTTACWYAAKTRPHPWRGLAAAQLACFAEVLVGMRLRAHDVADSLLRGEGWYAMRESAQIPLLVFAAAIGATWVIAVVVRWFRHDGLVCTAMVATSSVVMLFVVEAISLHGIDAVMYARWGPFMTIALLWLAGAAVVSQAALRSWRR